MSHIRVLICRVDDPTTDHMTELAAFDMPTPDVATLEPTTTLDDLETRCFLSPSWINLCPAGCSLDHLSRSPYPS